MARIVCGRWPRLFRSLARNSSEAEFLRLAFYECHPSSLVLPASLCLGIGSQRNREMLSADNIHPRQAPLLSADNNLFPGRCYLARVPPVRSRNVGVARSSDLGGSPIGKALCGCFAACYPKERLAFGTGRLVLLNSIRTVRREVDSPLDRVPMSHVMAPSLTPAMPRPCVRMRRTKRISSLAIDVASADCAKPGQVTAITIEPGGASSLLLGRARRGGEPSPGRLSDCGRERDGTQAPPLAAHGNAAPPQKVPLQEALSSVVNLGDFGEDGISIPRKTASNIRSSATARE